MRERERIPVISRKTAATEAFKLFSLGRKYYCIRLQPRRARGGTLIISVATRPGREQGRLTMREHECEEWQVM